MERLKHIVQINILLGAWLVVAPFVMGYSGTTVEMVNDVALGVWLIGCSWWILAAASRRVGAERWNFSGGSGSSLRRLSCTIGACPGRSTTTSRWASWR